MEHLLTKLKSIEPQIDFQKRSRALVLAAPQNHPEPNFWHSLAANYRFSVAIAVLILMLSGLSLFSTNLGRPTLASLDPKSLKNEVDNLDLQIKLSQAEYYADSVDRIEVALKETSGELPSSVDAEIDELINKLTL